MKKALLTLAISLCASGHMLSQAAAITTDPAPDAAFPPAMAAFTIPSHGSMMNAIAYVAAGEGAHPVVVLLQGFPGNEKNLDLAQAIRRTGYDVVQVYYRGSWGSQGAFSFAHVMEDVAATVSYLRVPENAKRLRVDPEKIVMVGHSMGGWMALEETAADPNIRAVITISAADMAAGNARTAAPLGHDAGVKAAAAKLAGQGLTPLAGCTPESLAAELIDHGSQWAIAGYAKGIGQRPALLITSDDGLAPVSVALVKSLQAAGNTQAREAHVATDHSYSGKRIALEELVLAELAKLKLQ